MTTPKVEIGQDETGARWCVYLDGLPVSRSFILRRDAALVMDWLLAGGMEYLQKLSDH